MERFLEPCEDITADGTIIHEQLDAADETRQLDIKKIFRRKATTATAAAAANAPNPVEALNQDRVHTDMKDRIYYAREEVRCAIDILLKLEATVQEPGGPQQPAAEKPLITIAPTTKQSVSNIPKQIDQIKSTLSAKKMHLIQISSAFDKAATRLNSTLANEMKFYGQVAIQQLRRHNWILHSKDERTGRGLYVDYGLTKAGSTSTEICEAYFTWSSSAVSSTKTATKNKITLKYGHGRPKLVQVLHKSGCSTNIPSLPCDYPEYSKIQKALSAAKQAAFDTELFHELSVSAAHSRIPGSVHLTPTTLTIAATPESPPIQIKLLSPSPARKDQTRNTNSSSPLPPPSRDDASSAWILHMLKTNLRRAHRANQARFLRVHGFMEWEESYKQNATRLFRKTGKQNGSGVGERRLPEESVVEDHHPSRVLESVVRVCEWRQVASRADEALDRVVKKIGDGGPGGGGWVVDVTVDRKLLAREGRVFWIVCNIGQPLVKVILLKSGALVVEATDPHSQRKKVVEVKDLCSMEEIVEQELNAAIGLL